VKNKMKIDNCTWNAKIIEVVRSMREVHDVCAVCRAGFPFSV
jgi:hypothetical protein